MLTINQTCRPVVSFETIPGVAQAPLLKEVVLSANATPSQMPADDVTRQFDALIGGRYPVVLAGFSGLGYDQPAAVAQKITELLDDAIKHHPEGVALVIGGTNDGIGMGYALVKENPNYEAVKLIGLVSATVKEKSPGSLSKECGDNIIFVPDAKGSWEILNPEGSHSYTAFAAEKGEFNVLGGGAVAKTEIEFAQKQGVSPRLFNFEPDQNELQKKLDLGKDRKVLTPLNEFFDDIKEVTRF